MAERYLASRRASGEENEYQCRAELKLLRKKIEQLREREALKLTEPVRMLTGLLK